LAANRARDAIILNIARRKTGQKKNTFAVKSIDFRLKGTLLAIIFDSSNSESNLRIGRRARMRQSSVFLVAAIALFANGSARVASADVLHSYAYDVTGYIDTSDYLIIQGSTLQWHHTDPGGAAVGRHAGNNFPTVISSTLDGVADMSGYDWTPTWPDPVPNEIRFDAFSSVLDTLSPAVPTSGPLSVAISVVSGRGSLIINQLPTDGNGDTTIIEFKDGFDGSANLDGLITISQVPEPGSIAILGIGTCALLRRRRMGV
jgi:hypothetical protein